MTTITHSDVLEFDALFTETEILEAKKMKKTNKMLNVIIEKLENGVNPWKKTWNGTRSAISHISGGKYSGQNKAVLMAMGGGEWLTANQCDKMGYKIKKGATSQIIKIYKPEQKNEETGEVEEKAVYASYAVFNIDDVLKSKHSKFTVEPKHLKIDVQEHNPIETAETLAKAYMERESVELIHRETKGGAFHMTDGVSYHIEIPLMRRFNTANDYYKTLFHEIIHNTGYHLGRDMTGEMGDDIYAREELVAELGALLLMDELGLGMTTLDNSTAYLQGWLKMLKSDFRLLDKAMQDAEKAVKFIKGEKRKKRQPKKASVAAAACSVPTDINLDGLDVVADKRAKGGALWVNGGDELKELGFTYSAKKGMWWIK